jgi:hypothetical protein
MSNASEARAVPSQRDGGALAPLLSQPALSHAALPSAFASPSPSAPTSRSASASASASHSSPSART